MNWCRGRDSNSHFASRRNTVLSRACLPISAPRLTSALISSKISVNQSSFAVNLKKMPTKKPAVIAVLSLLNLFAALAFWLGAEAFTKDFLNLQAVFTFALTFSLLLSLLSLSALLHENRLQSLLLVLPAGLVTLLLYPLSFPPLWLPPLFILTALFFFNNLRREKTLYIKPILAHLLPPHLGLLFLSLSLMTTVLYYQTTQPLTQTFKFQIPDELFNQALSFVLKATGANLPLDHTSLPSSQALNFSALPQANQLLQPLKEELNKQTAALLEPYRPFLPAVLSLSFFLTLNFFGAVIKGLALLLTSLSFFFLKYFQVVTIKKETREAETITL